MLFGILTLGIGIGDGIGYVWVPSGDDRGRVWMDEYMDGKNLDVGSIACRLSLGYMHSIVTCDLMFLLSAHEVSSACVLSLNSR